MRDRKIHEDLIKKGYSRIQEKIEEIRQTFSQTVISGRRSGSGKVVSGFYDEMKPLQVSESD